MENYLNSFRIRQSPRLDKPDVLQVSMLYTFVVVMYLFLRYRLRDAGFYGGTLVIQLVVILLPALILMVVAGYDLKRVLRLNSISVKNILLAAGLVLFAIPVIGMFNYFYLLLIKLIFGQIIPPPIPPSTDWSSFVKNVLFIALSAGICEEVLFRGVIQRGFERLGALRGIMITALLFGFMHASFQRLFGTFILGILIGYIVYRTNSLFSGMIAHFTNNFVAVALSFLSFKLSEWVKALEKAGKVQDAAQTPAYLQAAAAVFFWGVIVLFCISMLVLFFKAFLRNTRSISRDEGITDEENAGRPGIWLTVPGVLMIGIIYVSEGLGLMNRSVDWVNNIIRFIQG